MGIIKILPLILVMLVISCKNKQASKEDRRPTREELQKAYADQESSNEEDNSSGKYKDGTYCATVEYYNPNTGTRNSYDLSVEVEDGELTVIHWPNGGWLDDSHFTPEELDEDGSVSFTSDKGYEYTVTIDSEGPCVYTNTNGVSPSRSEELHQDEGEGYVIWSMSGCNYVIIDCGGWYVVADKSYGAYSLSKGDRIRGDIASYGMQEFYNISNSEQEEVYVDNYYASKSSALEKVAEKCNLNEDEE